MAILRKLRWDWRCPADKSYGIRPDGTQVPRVRSVAMNNWVGGNGDTPPHFKGFWGAGNTWVVYRKITSMVNPGPAMTFVMLDEWQESINDGYFVTEMDGWPNPNSTKIVDFPASYHNRAAGFSFADGHSEIHRWLDPRNVQPETAVKPAHPE